MYMINYWSQISRTHLRGHVLSVPLNHPSVWELLPSAAAYDGWPGRETIHLTPDQLPYHVLYNTQ